MASYRFVFSSPNWIKNVILCAIASLVPIAGLMVLFGYIFEIIEALHKKGKNAPAPGESYPDFDLNKITDYLMRGIVPFVVAMVFGVVGGIVLGITYLIGVLVMAAVAKMGGVVVGVVALFLFLILMALALVFNLINLPFLLRAGLTRDFGSAFSMPFAKDFLSRVGKETFIALLFWNISSSVVMGLGLLLCIVGIYPASAIAILAFVHLEYQLYELYLSKG